MNLFSVIISILLFKKINSRVYSFSKSSKNATYLFYFTKDNLKSINLFLSKNSELYY